MRRVYTFQTLLPASASAGASSSSARAAPAPSLPGLTTSRSPETRRYPPGSQPPGSGDGFFRPIASDVKRTAAVDDHNGQAALDVLLVTHVAVLEGALDVHLGAGGPRTGSRAAGPRAVSTAPARSGRRARPAGTYPGRTSLRSVSKNRGSKTVMLCQSVTDWYWPASVAGAVKAPASEPQSPGVAQHAAGGRNAPLASL